MKKSRFSEEQIIGILQEQEAGMKTAEVCRKHGISQNSKPAVAKVNCRIPDLAGCRNRPYTPFRSRVERHLIRVSLDKGQRKGFDHAIPSSK